MALKYKLERNPIWVPFEKYRMCLDGQLMTLVAKQGPLTLDLKEPVLTWTRSYKTFDFGVA